MSLFGLRKAVWKHTFKVVTIYILGFDSEIIPKTILCYTSKYGRNYLFIYFIIQVGAQNNMKCIKIFTMT